MLCLQQMDFIQYTRQAIWLMLNNELDFPSDMIL